MFSILFFMTREEVTGFQIFISGVKPLRESNKTHLGFTSMSSRLCFNANLTSVPPREPFTAMSSFYHDVATHDARYISTYIPRFGYFKWCRLPWNQPPLRHRLPYSIEKVKLTPLIFMCHFSYSGKNPDASRWLVSSVFRI